MTDVYTQAPDRAVALGPSAEGVWAAQRVAGLLENALRIVEPTVGDFEMSALNHLIRCSWAAAQTIGEATADTDPTIISSEARSALTAATMLARSVA